MTACPKGRKKKGMTKCMWSTLETCRGTGYWCVRDGNRPRKNQNHRHSDCLQNLRKDKNTNARTTCSDNKHVTNKNTVHCTIRRLGILLDPFKPERRLANQRHEAVRPDRSKYGISLPTTSTPPRSVHRFTRRQNTSPLENVPNLSSLIENLRRTPITRTPVLRSQPTTCSTGQQYSNVV